MSKTSMKLPITVNQKEGPVISNLDSGSSFNFHQQQWSDKVYECVVCVGSEGTLNLTVNGGSDNGEFAYFGPLSQDRINYLAGRVEPSDIILEIQGQKVAGYTRRDIVAWLNHCCRNGTPVTIRAVKGGSVTNDLRQFLNSRFQKGSLDHDLQNTIRDNLYLRTVPCTTRTARDGEVNGVDYTFLTIEEFKALEKSGNLLESGIYEDNFYGTPRPSPASSGFTPKPNNPSSCSASFPQSSLHHRVTSDRVSKPFNVSRVSSSSDCSEGNCCSTQLENTVISRCTEHSTRRSRRTNVAKPNSDKLKTKTVTNFCSECSKLCILQPNVDRFDLDKRNTTAVVNCCSKCLKHWTQQVNIAELNLENLETPVVACRCTEHLKFCAQETNIASLNELKHASLKPNLYLKSLQENSCTSSVTRQQNSSSSSNGSHKRFLTKRIKNRKVYKHTREVPNLSLFSNGYAFVPLTVLTSLNGLDLKLRKIDQLSKLLKRIEISSKTKAEGDSSTETRTNTCGMVRKSIDKTLGTDSDKQFVHCNLQKSDKIIEKNLSESLSNINLSSESSILSCKCCSCLNNASDGICDVALLCPDVVASGVKSASALPGNHYGTPKPPKESPLSPLHRTISDRNGGSVILPGAHPSSEGKRRRNRSNVEAMASKSMDSLDTSAYPLLSQTSTSRSSTPTFRRMRKASGDPRNDNLLLSTSLELGPLPDNWEKAYTETGECYFIDHNTGSSQWLDPRLARVQKKKVEDCEVDELPYGWERIDDPHYGTYYIDHVNRRTQYENPVLQARRGAHPGENMNWYSRSNSTSSTVAAGQEAYLADHPWMQYAHNGGASSGANASDSSRGHSGHTNNELVNSWVAQSSGSVSREPVYQGQEPYRARTSHGRQDGPSQKPHRTHFFTRNPSELQGELIHTSLVKSSRGFGFTIVGGDDGNIEEFLQIKSVVPNGPAWLDGKLQTGDVLVYVSNTCVLGYSHQDVVQLFQSIAPEETVHLEVCRGYILPFDPEDPNNEIVTTVAVAVEENRPTDATDSFAGSGANNGNLAKTEGGDAMEALGRSAKSMPDLSERQTDHAKPYRHNSADILSPTVSESTPDILDFNPHSSSKPEYLTVEIVKGGAGFGFTIADSAYGQKVKKILDRPRCKLLQEGDVLVEINHHDVKGMTHADVVQVLKDCPCGSSAMITVQRGGLLSPNRGKTKSKGKLLDASRKSNSTSSFSFSDVPQATGEGYLPPVRGAYRSKTPTADLYSTREREVVTVNRPKTPLVDTRNWSRSAETPRHLGASKSAAGGIQGRSFSALETFLASGSSELPSKPRTQQHPYDDETFGLGWFENSANRNGKDPWTNRSFRENRVNPQKDIYHYVRRASEQTLPNTKENHIKVEGIVNGSYSVDENNYLQSHYAPERPVKKSGNPAHHYNPTWAPLPESPHRDERLLNFESHPAAMHSQKPPAANGPVYSPYYEPVAGNGATAYSIMGGYGTVISPASNQFLRHDSGYYTAAGMSPHASNASHQSFGGSQYDSLTRRKHSTSFEHEQPITSTMTQYPRDVANFPQYGGYRVASPNAGRVADNIDNIDMTVTLHRQENGFGFRIVGGTEEGSQVSIGHIVPGGAANLDGRLHSGDAIVTVDGQSVLNTSHHHVVQLMGNAATNGRVTLGIRRKLVSFDSYQSSKSTESIYPYDIIVTRRENEGFGFVIISSVSRSGSTIGRIIEGSPAERCGQLHVGDRILAVNGVSILNMHHGEIVNLIKESGFTVTLTIGPPQDDTSSTTSVSQRGDEHSMEQEDVYFAVELLRGARGFGFSIRGGREFQNMPLFVLRIAEQGPAHQDGRLQVGDQIIEINGTNTKNMTHADAIEIIKQGGNSVRLLVRRSNRIPLAVVDHPSPITPTGSVGTPLSAVSSMLNGPICQSSPRDIPTYELSRDVWNYDPH